MQIQNNTSYKQPNFKRHVLISPGKMLDNTVINHAKSVAGRYGKNDLVPVYPISTNGEPAGALFIDTANESGSKLVLKKQDLLGAMAEGAQEKIAEFTKACNEIINDIINASDTEKIM